MSEWLLFNVKLAYSSIMARTNYIFQYQGENKLHTDAMMMMMMTDLDYTSMLSLILIVLAHWNKSLRAQRGHFIWIPSKPMFALFSYCCVASRKTTNTNLLSLVWPDPCFLTLYRWYKLKLNISRKAWNIKEVN